MTPVEPAIALPIVVIASYLMVGSGLAKRRLVWRSKRCPSCGHPYASCTCYWR